MKHRLSNLQPLSLSSLFERTSKKNTPATRGLKLESLENRELLSATTWESPAAGAVADNAAIVLSVQSDMAPISLATLDASVESIEATMASLGSNKANIEWTRVDGATKYYLMSCTSTDGENYSAWSGLKNVNDPGDASDADTVSTQLTLTAGKYYKFRVRAVTSDGTTDFTETPEAIVANKPEAPVITSATVDHATGIATVEFDTVENANLYRFDYTFDDGATWQFATYVSVGEGEATSTKIFIDADATSASVTHALNANKTYYFRVRATNAFGASEYSDLSDPVAYKGAAAPQWVSAQEQVGTHKASITWAASDSATEYFIQSSTDGGETWSAVKKTAADSFTYDDTTDSYSYSYFISTGKTYLYRVRAYNALGTDGSSTVSDQSVALSVVGDVENFTVAGAEAVNPTTYPIGERYSKVTVTLTWDAADNATKYVVKYSKDGGDWKLLKNINDPSVTSTTFSTVAGSYYNFKIMATNSLSSSEEVETGVYGVYKTALNRVDVVAGEVLVPTTVAPASVTAAYQWQYRTADDDWTDIAGATEATYTPTAEDVANLYWIRVLVSGAQEDCPAGSYAAEGVAGPVLNTINAPSNFTFGEYDSETNKLPMSWVDNSDNEDGFYVEYSIDGGETWAKSAWLDADVTERTGAVYEENTYQFRIRAYNASGYSAWAYSKTYPNLGPDVPSLCVTIPGDVVDPNDGEISLREAILYAAQYPELGNEITFAPWLDGQTITVTNGELAVNQTLTFNGSGQNITVSAGYASRLFKVSASGVTFDGLTLANGSAFQGGAIYLNSGSVTVKNGGICDNRATNGYGSAVYVNRGTLTIDSSRVTGNTGRNGTIYARRGTTVNVVNSLMVENSATNGGVVYAANGSTLQVYNATITNNTATSGAALYIDSATVKMYNTIIYDNNEYSWYISGWYSIETHNCLVSADYTYHRPPIGSNHNNVTGYGVVLDSNYRPYYNSENDKSIAIDAGNIEYVNFDTDLAGDSRIVGQTVDIGCYELQSDGSNALLDDVFAELVDDLTIDF